MAYQCRAFVVRANHDAGAVHENNHRNVERVAQLKEPCAFVGAGTVYRTGQVRRVVRHHTHRLSFNANKRGNHTETKVFTKLQDRAFVSKRTDNVAHGISSNPIFRDDMAHPALIWCGPIRRRPLKVGQILFDRCDRRFVIFNNNVDIAIACLNGH